MQLSHKFTITGLLFAPTLWAVPLAHAQAGGAAAFGGVKSVVISPEQVKAGQKATILVTFSVNDGFHINANKPGDDTAIPTILSLNASKSSGIVLGRPLYPDAKMIPTSYSTKPIKGYDSTIIIRVPVTIQATAKPGSLKITGTLRAQGCNATTCFPPQSFPISVAVTVTGGKK